MELVSLAKEALQDIAEHAASYRPGQTVLRYLDRTLWVVEKCARWAVPPPLDQDDRPQPELVRPLPWILFLFMLITLRVTRESISLVNLVMGKPPLRSADVVMYLQSKRRYLRTLKYQGNRMMRARTSTAQPSESWSQSLRSMFEFTMCFRRHSPHYGNNNTTSVSNNDEVLVVKRSKRGREHSSPVASTSETTMERLIEKMLVDLDADSDEDSFTLTNVTSQRSDRSDITVDSDQEAVAQNNTCDNNTNDSNMENTSEVTSKSPHTEDTLNSSNRSHTESASSTASSPNNSYTDNTLTPAKSSRSDSSTENLNSASTPSSSIDSNELKSSSPEKSRLAVFLTKETASAEDTSKEESNISNETSPSKIPRTPNNEQRMANGRTVKSVPSKKKGSKNMEKHRRGTEIHAEKGGHATI